MCIFISVHFKINLAKQDVKNCVLEGYRYIIVTRYLTDEEKTDKFEEMARAGRRVTYIPPYSSQGITKDCVYKLINQRAIIMDNIFLLQSSLPLTTDATRLELSRDLHLTLDEDSGTVHLRRWWWNNKSQKLCPNKRGVCLSAECMQSILELLPEVYAHMLD